jgi:hypothetical protein
VRYYLDEGDPVIFLDLQDILLGDDRHVEIVRVGAETLLAPMTRLGRSVLVTSRRLADLELDARLDAFTREGGVVLRIDGRPGTAAAPGRWPVLERPFTEVQFLRALKSATRP